MKIKSNIKNIMNHSDIFLYGKLKERHKAVAYCTLHKCYLEPMDIKEKGCNYKRCTYKREVKTK